MEDRCGLRRREGVVRDTGGLLKVTYYKQCDERGQGVSMSPCTTRFRAQEDNTTREREKTAESGKTQRARGERPKKAIQSVIDKKKKNNNSLAM